MATESNMIIGLDIGTTKICAIIGEINPAGQIDIIGMGTSPSKGVRKGVVVNIDSTVESIKKAVQEAELMAGVEIDNVYAGIAGGHIRGINSRGVIAISGKNKEITKQDIERAIDAAKAIALPSEREIIHVLPQEFIVDDQDGIKEPLGMSGVRLEVEIHIITGAVTSVQNIIKSVNRAGLEVKDVVLEQLASSEAVLTQDEKYLGIALIDIGGGSTNIALFKEGAVWHTSVLALGGEHITNDIAMGLRTPAIDAEDIKRKYGCALKSMIRDEETIEVPSVGGRKPRILSRQILSEIIQPRVEEILTLAAREISKAGFEDLATAGVVITGGAAIMEGVPELAEQIFDLPVRRGIPMGIGGLKDIVSSPIHGTGVGLVLYGAKKKLAAGINPQEEAFFTKIMKRLREWFSELF